jgi:hypothetical protein
MSAQNILARIKLKHVKGAEIAYLYDFEILKSISSKPSDFDPSETLLNVGDIIDFDEQKFRIVNINTKFFKETEDLNQGKGTNLVGIGEQLPFNFQITYVLDNEY